MDFLAENQSRKIQGIDKSVDLNVFYGSQAQWDDFLRTNKIENKPSKN